jgi:hypothetical protein
MSAFYSRLPHFEYLRSRSLGHALALVGEHGASAAVMAGGTGVIPQLRPEGTKALLYLVDLVCNASEPLAIVARTLLKAWGRIMHRFQASQILVVACNKHTVRMDELGSRLSAQSRRGVNR